MRWSTRVPWEAGHSLVAELRRRNVHSLAFVAISHLHADHLAGLKAVLDYATVRHIWVCSEASSWYRKTSPLVFGAPRILGCAAYYEHRRCPDRAALATCARRKV